MSKALCQTLLGCVSVRQRSEKFQDDVSPWCIVLEINKISFFLKKDMKFIWLLQSLLMLYQHLCKWKILTAGGKWCCQRHPWCRASRSPQQGCTQQESLTRRCSSVARSARCCSFHDFHQQRPAIKTEMILVISLMKSRISITILYTSDHKYYLGEDCF